MLGASFKSSGLALVCLVFGWLCVCACCLRGRADFSVPGTLSRKPASSNTEFLNYHNIAIMAGTYEYIMPQTTIT